MPTKTTDPIVQRLESVAQKSPELDAAARIYAVLLPLLREADVHAAPIAIDRDQAHTKLAQRQPLLQDIDLDLDYTSAGGLMLQLARALERARIRAAHPLRLALQQGKLDARALLPRVAAGDHGYVSTLAEGLELDPGLVWTISQNALKPALRAWCRQLSPFLDGAEWRRGYCPVCGAAATLAELQSNEQAKHLRCAQCGADWPFSQLQCTYCGNEDHGTLGYLYPDGERERRGVQVCDRCGGYLKVIASFSPTPVDLLPVQDLATLPLDYIAQARGYARVEVR